MSLPNNQIADCSDQAHIFISDRRINPDGTQDTRPFDTVVHDGLLPGFNILDAIHPLSQTILHEVITLPTHTTHGGYVVKANS